MNALLKLLKHVRYYKTNLPDVLISIFKMAEEPPLIFIALISCPSLSLIRVQFVAVVLLSIIFGVCRRFVKLLSPQF